MIDQFIQSVSIRWDKISESSYLHDIPALKSLSQLGFHKPVTFFVGENGN